MSRLAQPPRQHAFSKPQPPHAPPQPPSLQAVAEQLEALLRGMISEHETLLQITGRHRAALAAADREQIDRCVSEQRDAAHRLSLLDGQRNILTRAATAALRGALPAGVSPTAAMIAAACPEPQRSRLLDLAARARTVATEVSARQGAVRMAAETLMAHMQGLITQVTQSLSHTGTYARPSAPALASAQVVSMLDLTS